jgi:C4-dicarboxylate-specific signal transduction histidine kinase
MESRAWLSVWPYGDCIWGSRKQSALADVVSDGHRTSEILNNIRTVFGVESYEQEEVDANATVSAALHLIRTELDDHRITTNVDLTYNLPAARGNKSQLQEVIINLLHNAIEAMVSNPESERRLTVRTKMHDANSIAVEVEDTGPGIMAEDRDRIFEAFVTTKSKGAGLGLAVSRAIVERLRGQLAIFSANPRGAIFQIVLPQMDLPH